MPIFKLFAAAFLLFSALSASALQSAYAQGTVVLVIDSERLLQESKAGKDIQTKLQNIETTINNELAPTRRELEGLAQALQPKIQGKTAETIAADTALANEVVAFERKRQELAQKINIASQEFAMTEQKALMDFDKALEPVFLEVVREKNAQIVLRRGQVVWAGDAIDATGAIVAKLDQRTPAIAVTRQRMPAQQQQ